MFNVCPECGLYRVDKEVDAVRGRARCPECGHEIDFRCRPLLAVGGPSGAGKSAALIRIVANEPAFVPLEGDIFWRNEFATPENGYRDFFELLLRTAKNVNQSDRTAVLFNAGCATVENLERCDERRYFSSVHVLALVAPDDVIRERLTARPGWRESADEGFIDGQLAFSAAIRARNNDPRYTVIDTSGESVDTTASRVRDWITDRLEG